MNDTRRLGATAAANRITSLDVVRGVAVLGILTMNVVSFALPDAAYFNIDASSPQSTLDWIVGAAGEIFADQKFMGMFSMLFGAGIVLFADRAASKTSHPVWLSLWRNCLLLLIGIAHSLLWPGDVLTVYATVRSRPDRRPPTVEPNAVCARCGGDRRLARRRRDGAGDGR